MATLTCPRCFLEIDPDPGLKFCPRCGLADVVKAASDHKPVRVTAGGKTFRVLHRLAVGSLTSVYRCELPDGGQGIFKIARDARSNAAVANEASVLMKLEQEPGAEPFAPFLPRVVVSFAHGDAGREPPRRANVLCYHPEVESPDGLYTLAEVRDAYPNGLDQKDVAWIWRRLLNVLSFCHANGIAHTAVLPAHVLIEPVQHQLILIDWCFATTRERWKIAASVPGADPFRKWYQRQGVPRLSSPSLDISQAANCMLYLLNGSATPDAPSANIEPGVLRHFQRCVDVADETHPDARDLLSQFDRLIEALWGPRQFRPLTMPSRS
jgi:serine/threonine protein kinase